MQSRDSMSLTDRESSSDESDLSVSTQAARVSRCAEGKTQAARVWCAESEQSNPGRTGTVCGA